MSDPTNGSILVVDDEAELRFVLSAHLSAAGFEVLEATEGQQAIEIAARQRPDLIVMDVGLPGLDGVSATKLLKADTRTANIPVIMLTARSRTEDIVKGLEAGAQEYLPKPFDVAELMARVRTVHRLARAHKDLDRLSTQLGAAVDAETRRMQYLYEYMRDLNHADTRDEVLDMLVRVVKQTTGVERISLFLADPSGDNLVCERVLGTNPGVSPGMVVRKTEGITGQVFQSGKAFVARTYGDGAPGAPEYSRNAFLSTPLVTTSLETRDGVIGVLNVTEKSDDTPFSDGEVECIRAVADTAAIAVDNIRRRERLQQSVKVLLNTVGRLAEYRDEETTKHLERVATMSRILALELQASGPYRADVSPSFVHMLVQAAPMHDIGKVGIPDDILTKPGRLTDEEFQIMKSHTDIGRRVLSRAIDPEHPVPLLQMCVDIAWCHHEKFDGRGYPRRLAGDRIPLSARIIALVDAYDAITSERRYKPARSHDDAVSIIRAESGKHFDPVLVEAFLRCHEQFDEIRARHADEPVALQA